MTDANQTEWIEERAAILEFDAGMERGQAEQVAQMLWDFSCKDGGSENNDGVAQ